MGHGISAAEMARIIDVEHDSDRESVHSFVMRRFRHELASTLHAAVTLLIAREEFIDFFAALLDDARKQSVVEIHKDIGEIVEARRARGYDAEFEAYIARRWKCFECKQVTTVFGLLMPIGDPKRYPACPICQSEAIAPVEPVAQVEVIDGGKTPPC